MTKNDWLEVSANAKRLLSRVKEGAPKGVQTIPTAQIYVTGMFWRSVRLYSGTLLLLDTGLFEEAAILARSSFEESLRLRQLATQPESRDSLILGWAKDSYKQKIGLIRTAAVVGLNSNAQADVEALEAERTQMQEHFKRRNVSKAKRFLSVKDAALKFGREDDFWTYEWSHESVHGSDAAWLYSRCKVSPDTFALLSRMTDPDLLASIMAFASTSLMDAADSTASIMGWPAFVAARKVANRIHSTAQ